MSSIQERLQLKRVPLDTWNIREQLCLASAVVRSGDQNWMSVSRALKTVGEPNRPPDWYSQKSCAAQYGVLLEHVETPKRKKRCSEGAVETPQESIVKRLTQERIVEIQKTIAEMNQQYDQLKAEIAEARNPATSEDRLRDIWNSIEASKRAKEREATRRATLLKEREERRARTAIRPAPTTPKSPAAAPPSSPLLTSLLKSSPVVTTPQHIPHPAGVVDTVSPSVQAPTLSMLLEKSPQHDNKHTAPAQHDNKHAAIEHIKNQLVQIEQQLKASSAPTTPLPAVSASISGSASAPISVSASAPVSGSAPAVDIDDIEIKAEDVYVFRDIPLHIQPIDNRQADKTPKKDDVEIVVDNEPVDVVKEEQVNMEDDQRNNQLEVDIEQLEVTAMEVDEATATVAPNVSEEVKLAFPEVKFPTTEIKVIQPDEIKVKEEKEVEVSEEISQSVEEKTVLHEVETPVPQTVSEDDRTTPRAPSPEIPKSPSPPTEPQIPPPDIPKLSPQKVPEPEPIERPIERPVEQLSTKDIDRDIELQMAAIHSDQLPKDIPLPSETTQEETPPIPSEPEPFAPELEPKTEPELKPLPEPEHDSGTTVTEKPEDDGKKDEDAEDSIPLKQMIRSEGVRQEGGKPAEDAHTETDDDTPMELSREEEKDGKKKRDYSRKKKADSRTCSGSESGAESPAGSDAGQHRLWKKSVMLVHTRLCSHKYASLFLRPITDDDEPGYSSCVKRAMDLTTIKKNIENGVIRTTAEFQRDVLLMLTNALMYNGSEHSVHAMAREMHEEACAQLGMLLAAQAHAGLCSAPPATRKRHRH